MVFSFPIAIITKGKWDKAKPERQVSASQEREIDKKKNQDTKEQNRTKEIHYYYSKCIKT